MEILNKIVYALMLLSAIGVVVLVLLQHGKGADMGTGFGAGSSGSLFGATGAANFLSRSTAVLATVFFVCTLALAYMASHRTVAKIGGTESLPTQSLPTLPSSTAVPKLDAAPAAPTPTTPVAAPAPNEIPK